MYYVVHIAHCGDRQRLPMGNFLESSDFDLYNFLSKHDEDSAIGLFDRSHQRASSDVYYVPIMYSLRGLMMVSEKVDVIFRRTSTTLGSITFYRYIT